MFVKYALLGPALAAFSLFAQQSARVEFGKLQAGATVSFVRSTDRRWGVEIAGGPAPRILQPQPARLEVFRAEADIRQLAAGYKMVRKSPEGVDAQAKKRSLQNSR